MLNKTVFSISHYLHHVSASDLTEPCFFCMNFVFFFALELSSRFVDHTILISIQLTNLTKSFLIDLNIRVNWNHLILFELSFSLLANTLMHLTLSLYIYFSIFFGLVCCSRYEIPLATTCWTERFVYRYCSFSNLPRATRLYPFNIFFYLLFFIYYNHKRWEKKNLTRHSTKLTKLNIWIISYYSLSFFDSLTYV